MSRLLANLIATNLHDFSKKILSICLEIFADYLIDFLGSICTIFWEGRAPSLRSILAMLSTASYVPYFILVALKMFDDIRSRIVDSRKNFIISSKANWLQ